MKKITLHLAPVNGGAFNCLPAREVELAPESILCNDIILPWESHSRGMKLYVIGHEFGPVCAVWANHEQDAFDEMVDSDLGDCFLIEEKESEELGEGVARLGNAGEPADLTYAWIQTVCFDKARDIELICAFAEARGAGQKTLDT